MKIVRLYADKEGESHFDELTEPGIEFRVNAEFSRLIGAHGLMFKETKAQGSEPALGHWHTAPQRQYVLFLAGETEIEASDGDKRILKSGDVLLVEDTFGKGHRNRRLSPKPELWAFVRSEKF
jgi:quercetin dioxygenase-like cupin family protein